MRLVTASVGDSLRRQRQVCCIVPLFKQFHSFIFNAIVVKTLPQEGFPLSVLPVPSLFGFSILHCHEFFCVDIDAEHIAGFLFRYCNAYYEAIAGRSFH